MAGGGCGALFLVAAACGGGGGPEPASVPGSRALPRDQVVAAPAFPVAPEDDAAGDWTTDLPKVPGDVSFVVDEVLRLTTDPVPPLQGAVNPERSGVAGHSMGGMITRAVAGNTCCRGDRIKAAVVYAGRESPSVGATSGPGSSRRSCSSTEMTTTTWSTPTAAAPSPTPRRPASSSPSSAAHNTPYSGDISHPQADLVAEALDFLDHFLHSGSGGPRPPAVPGLGPGRGQVRTGPVAAGRWGHPAAHQQ